LWLYFGVILMNSGSIYLHFLYFFSVWFEHFWAILVSFWPFLWISFKFEFFLNFQIFWEFSSFQNLHFRVNLNIFGPFWVIFAISTSFGDFYYFCGLLDIFSIYTFPYSGYGGVNLNLSGSCWWIFGYFLLFLDF